MPKETFFNLPEEKREKIIDAAMDEFAARSYHKARITAIADKAGIAMGSFYQYFDDKKDLFTHIIDLAVEKKLEYINHDMMANMDKYSFFQIFRGTLYSGMKFAKENPRLASVAITIAKDAKLRREIWNEYEDRSSEFYRQLLEYGVAKDELDPALDLDLVAKLLTTLNYSMGDIVFDEGLTDLQDEEAVDKIAKTFDKILYFIENGIKRRK